MGGGGETCLISIAEHVIQDLLVGHRIGLEEGEGVEGGRGGQGGGRGGIGGMWG